MISETWWYKTFLILIPLQLVPNSKKPGRVLPTRGATKMPVVTAGQSWVSTGTHTLQRELAEVQPSQKETLQHRSLEWGDGGYDLGHSGGCQENSSSTIEKH